MTRRWEISDEGPGAMAGHGRYLIVNADDFGLSEGVNRGILRAFDDGIVTSASLMVRQPAAASAAGEAALRPELSVGLHLDLGEWVFRNGSWETVYEVVRADDASATADEIRRQLDQFVSLVGRMPTHLDSHQHVHRSEPVRTAAIELAGRLNVPLRHFTPRVTYNGAFYGQDGKGNPSPVSITPDALAEVIGSLPLGASELACHPGDETPVESVYAKERAMELVTLCDPRVRCALREYGVGLMSFLQL